MVIDFFTEEDDRTRYNTLVELLGDFDFHNPPEAVISWFTMREAYGEWPYPGGYGQQPQHVLDDIKTMALVREIVRLEARLKKDGKIKDAGKLPSLNEMNF
ncbi:MAG: hypothetical protein CUN54_08410 [Phototrophicales bacterium]|nr:MAG: hypothetical protein CUN54_08410 [Phototrophicales bacterium]